MRASSFFTFSLIGLFMAIPAIASAQKIVAHRGASFDAPENTLASFRLAWQQNADAIEGDFYLTKDEQIVCIHDSKTERTSGEAHEVSKTTLEELRRLDVGSWKDPKFKGEKIPTLTEVLQIVPDNKQIYIEIKCGPEIVPYLIPVLKKSGLRPDQTIVISFNDKVIAATREQIPDIRAYWLTGFRQVEGTNEFEPTTDAVFEKIHKVRSHGIDAQANRHVLTADFVKRLRAENLGFHIWTVNNPDDARHFQQLGVDSITTDRPAFLRAELKK